MLFTFYKSPFDTMGLILIGVSMIGKENRMFFEIKNKLLLAVIIAEWFCCLAFQVTAEVYEPITIGEINALDSLLAIDRTTKQGNFLQWSNNVLNKFSKLNGLNLDALKLRNAVTKLANKHIVGPFAKTIASEYNGREKVGGTFMVWTGEWKHRFEYAYALLEDALGRNPVVRWNKGRNLVTVTFPPSEFRAMEIYMDRSNLTNQRLNIKNAHQVTGIAIALTADGNVSTCYPI
jgi:hypothetical protein